MKKIVALILTFALLMIPSFAVEQVKNEPVEVIEGELSSAGNGARLSSKPIMISPIEYEEIPCDMGVKLDWVAPQEIGVSYYRVRVREFWYDDSSHSFVAEANLTVDTIVNAQTTEFVLSSAMLAGKWRRRYRYAIAAVTVDNTEYWREGYFYTSEHSGIHSAPISFHIGNYFSEQTKSQIYYACQTWNNELDLGYEVVNTYPFAQGTNMTGRSRDGVSTVVGNYFPVGSPMGWAYCYKDDDYGCIEADIVINRNVSWANSAQPGKYDIQSTMTHEMGHVIGLTDKHDSWLSLWTMYGASENTIHRRTPEYDEVYSAYNFFD